MVFGPIIGAGFGAVAGAALGAAVFRGDRPKDLKFITEAADRDDNIRTPAAANVSDKMRALIPLTPEWTQFPDYDRWNMINRVVRLMWPNLTGAILDAIVDGMRPTLQGIIADLAIPGVTIQDITLGSHSLLDADHLDAFFSAKDFTLGSDAIRVAGMKVYQTTEDNCTMEMPLMWGSRMVVDLQVYAKIGPINVVIPIHVSDVQYKLLTRVTLSLVDTIPCIGGATVTLLEPPHIDYKLKMFGGIDLMALPGVKTAVQYVVNRVISDVMLYPNSVSVPLMTNFGAPSEPVGMLKVHLQKIEGFKTNDVIGKGDPYVEFSVRDGRSHASRVVRGSRDPEWNEDFYLVVDDLKDQMLTIKVWDEDLGPQNELVGVIQLYFTSEEVEEDDDTLEQKVVYKPRACVAAPMTEEHLVLPILSTPGPALASLGILGTAVTGAVGAVTSVGGAVGGLVGLRRGRGEEEEAPLTTTIKVAKKAGEVRQKQDATEGHTALAARKTVLDEAGGYWEELTEQAARIVAVKQIVKEEAKAEAEALAKLPKKERAKVVADKAAAAKEADDEIVLIDEVVTLRGNTPPAQKAVERSQEKGEKVKNRGNLHLSLTFMPFTKPEYDDDIETKPAKLGFAAYVPFEPPRAREIAANVSDYQKGLLTVKLIQAKSLSSAEGVMASTNPYVELLLVDCDKLRHDERKVSRVIYNDRSPRWDDKFDFVMVSAGSVLTVNVWDKTSALEMATSLKLSKSRFTDRLVGRVTIPVADVVRNGHIKDSFALQDAESGTIEMKLEWANCFVDDYVD